MRLLFCTLKHHSMGILGKNTIEQWIVPHLSKGKRGFSSTVPVSEIVLAIFYRLKTGCQWRQLPTKEFFSDKILSWNTVFYHFNRWSKDGSWRTVWIELLKANRHCLNLSSLELDGSHTPVKRGGQAVGYQGRKACKTTNSLFFCDNQGIMISMATPQEGQHNDLFQIQVLFEQLCLILKEADISIEGLLLNADPGFDSENLKQECDKSNIVANIKPNMRNISKQKDEPYESGKYIFDEELYKQRYVIERANAWIDSLKALLIRFEFTIRNWMSLHYMAFTAIFLRKIIKNSKV